MILPCLTIAPSGNKGRGVFTTEFLPQGTVIEISPVLVLCKKESVDAEKTMLYNYFFAWGKKGVRRALGLGYISLYNHSYSANCTYDMDFEFDTMTITTVKDIAAGEELFINYNSEPDDTTPIWFHAE